MSVVPDATATAAAAEVLGPQQTAAAAGCNMYEYISCSASLKQEEEEKQ